jgi:hypothetical protein
VELSLLARRLLVLVSAAFVAASCGCSAPADVEEQVSTLKPLAVLYGRFLAQHRGQPPANEAEFRAFVEKEGPSLLEQFAVKDVPSLFVSARDNQPYTILYGRLTGPPGPGGQPVFAYEKTGVGGKRMVASSLGAVEEVDEARFKELVPTAPAGG